MKIGILIIATNAYLPLGIRFVKKFLFYYTGNAEINFHFFSDEDPKQFLSENEAKFVIYHNQHHKCWVDGTNSKYNNIINLKNTSIDYIFYFDADTDVDKKFDESWFLGDIVTGEHYGNRTFMADKKPFDNNPKSKAYVDPNSELKKMYYYGAFFGGKKDQIIKFANKMIEWQNADKQIGYEPIWNDESYLNSYFHYNPPSKVVSNEEFVFLVSDKGGLPETRNANLDISLIKNKMIKYKNQIYNIKNNVFYQI